MSDEEKMKKYYFAPPTRKYKGNTIELSDEEKMKKYYFSPPTRKYKGNPIELKYKGNTIEFEESRNCLTKVEKEEKEEEEEKEKKNKSTILHRLTKMKSYESRYIIKESKHLIIILHLIIQCI